MPSNYFVIPMQDVENLEQLGVIMQPENRPYYPATRESLVHYLNKAITERIPIHNELKEGKLRVELEVLIAVLRSKFSAAIAVTPEHYKLKGLGIQWLDVRNAILSSINTPLASFVAVTTWSESITYLARMWRKNGIEDAYKARFYLDAMIAELEGSSATPRTSVEHDLRTELAIVKAKNARLAEALAESIEEDAEAPDRKLLQQQVLYGLITQLFMKDKYVNARFTFYDEMDTYVNIGLWEFPPIFKDMLPEGLTKKLEGLKPS